MQNQLFEMRMKEFRMNYINRPTNDENLNPSISISRPKRSVSPLEAYDSFIDNSNTNDYSNVSPMNNKVNYLTPFYNHQDSGFYQNTSYISSSPYLLPIQNQIQNRLLNDVKKSIQFQSTPNKSFPKPEMYMPNNSGIENVKNKSKVNFHSILDLAASSDESRDDSKLANNSQFVLNATSNQISNDYSTFNEKLKAMSQMISFNNENSNDLISKTKRKPRTQINKQQKEILEYAYRMKSYPDSNEIEYLCNLLGFEENVIRIWFQNKRARNKQRN